MSASHDAAEVEQGLADELLRLHKQSYGTGAGSSRVRVMDDAVICILDDIELLPNEHFLVEAGDADAVIHVRSRYQQAIETTFRAAVERATGRRVVSFVSATKVSPNWVVEIFRLAESHGSDQEGDPHA